MAICIDCGEQFSDRRAALRDHNNIPYRTCLDCGSPAFLPPVIPMTKSNYVVGTMADLKESYGAKGARV